MDTWSALREFQARSIATTGNRDSLLEKEFIKEFLIQVPMPSVFECLQEASQKGSTNEVKLVCHCLERIFRSEVGPEILFQESMLPFIVAGISHDEVAAKALTLDMLDDHDILLHAICDCLLDEDAAIARRASSILLKLVSVPDTGVYHKVLLRLRDLVADYLSRPSRENSVEFVRLLELISRCAGVSDTVMRESIALGLVEPILDGIESSDALFQLNVLDIIPNLCTTQAGLLHLFHSDLLAHLVACATNPLVGGNALRLIGTFSTLAVAQRVESWNWTDGALAKAFLAAVESSFQVGDSQQQIAAMDAIAAFGSASDKELGLLLAHRSLCDAWLSLGKSALLEVKSACFISLATILTRGTRLSTRPNDVLADENATLWTFHRRLFHALGHPWGLEALHAYGGFIEFLGDRSTEPTKITREWKFAILDAILASKFQHVFGVRAVDELTKAFEQGPYAGRAQHAEPMLDAN